MEDSRPVSTRELILVPSIITLAISLLRLIGELLNWNPSLFGKEAGGGASLVGISWLVPIFGFYFAWRLVKAGEPPARLLVAFGSAIGAFIVIFAAGALTGLMKLAPMAILLIFGACSWVSVWIAYAAWPALGRVLLAYAFAARIPVAIIMLVAIYANWGTHYDVANPQWPAVDTWNPLFKWLAIGALPQFTVWIAFTLVIGLFFGALAIPFARRFSAPSATTAS